MAGVFVVGEQHNRAACVAGCHHHVLQGVARLTLGIHNDHVGLQLRQTLGQKGVGGQSGNQIKTVFQQTNAQTARARRQFQLALIPRVGVERVGHDDDEPQMLGRVHAK